MDSGSGAAVRVRRCVLATTADELVIRVCPIVGPGRGDERVLSEKGKVAIA
jgi:hypothetical protein